MGERMDDQKRNAIAKRLEKLTSLGGGRLTPEAVVQDAKSKTSPLHDQFEWDDSEAGKQWRLQQARELIRSVKIEIQTETRVVSTVRYVRDPAAGAEQGYVEVAKLRDDKALAKDALMAEMRAASALFERAKTLAEALGLHQELQIASEQVQAIQELLKAA